MWPLVVLFVLLQGIINQVVNGLPSNLIPLSYNLTISTHLNGGPSQNRYVGLVSIRLLVINETREVIFNYRDIAINAEKTMLIRKLSGLRIGIDNWREVKETDEYRISFKKPLLRGEQYILYLIFSGNMAKPNRHGYFASFYKDINSTIGQRLYSLARFDRKFARTAFPCLDEPQFRSNFTLYMAHRSDYVCLSNMPASKTWKHPTIDGYVWTKFEESPPLATHMLTWTLHQLDLIAQTQADDGTKLKIWARPEKEIEGESLMFNEVLDASKLLLTKCQQLFGMPLPLGNATELKIDHIVLPQHPKYIFKRGLLVYSENMLRSGTAQQEHLFEVLATYFVHQWNGILVSVSSWRDEWIFNGLTTYLSIQLINQIKQDSNYNQTRLLEVTLWVMQEDLITVPKLVKRNRYNHQLESLRIRKVCVLLNMLNSVIGWHVMESGFRNFWRNNANTVVTRSQLWNELQNTSRRFHVLPKGIDLLHVIESWLQQPGYPLIIVERNYESNSATITQERFSATTSSDQPCWWLPITYMSKSQRRPQQEWLSCDNNAPQLASITLQNVGQPDDWLIVNVNASVLQRTLYDLENWSKLYMVLKTDREQIPPINRAYIVDDALNLAWIGMLPYAVALSIVGYLPKETNSLVWQVAVRNLQKLHSIMYPTTGYRIFKSYMSAIVEGHLTTVLDDINKKSEESNNDNTNNKNIDSITVSTTVSTTASSNKKTPLRKIKQFSASQLRSTELPIPEFQIHSFNSIIYNLACRFEIANCIKDAAERFQATLSETPKQIPEEIRETVYCMAVRYGMEVDWVLVRNKYRTTKTLNDRRILLKGMACSVNHWALQKLLKWCFNKNKVSKFLIVDLLSALANNAVAFGLLKKYLIQHADEVKKVYDNNDILDILRPIVSGISNKEDLHEIELLINKEFPGIGNSSVQNLLQEAVAKVDWHHYRYFNLLNAIRAVLTTDDDE